MTQLPRNLILVTGAPRTATTPVGNMLGSCASTVSIYEPLGLTGITRVKNRFPMLNEPGGLSDTDLNAVLQDMARFRSGGLKPQQRPGKGFSLKRAIFGTRTLHSYRMAKLQPWAKNVIWKDPHAILLVPDIVEPDAAKQDMDVVVTARAALAHASSYKRLGWVSQAADIYPRWSARYGTCDVVERFLPQAQDPVISGALIWRMSYLPILRRGVLDKVHLVTSEALMADERGTYEALFAKLGLTPSAATQKALTKQKSDTHSRPSDQVTHDWTRSVAAVNSYWKELLSEEEIATVTALTEDVQATLFQSA